MFYEQHLARVCERESAKLERELDRLLESELLLKQLMTSSSDGNWLVRIPPGRSLDIVLNEIEGPASVLMRVPSQQDARCGIVHMSFDRPLSRATYDRFVINAFDYNQIVRRAADGAHRSQILFMTEPVSDLAQFIQLEEKMRNVGYRGLHSKVRVREVYAAEDPRSVVVCSFKEVARQNAKMQEKKLILEFRFR